MNITTPRSTLTQRTMVNGGGSTYECNYTAWYNGEYYYVITATDVHGGSSTYDPYFNASGNATASVYVVNQTYLSNQNVLLGSENYTQNKSIGYDTLVTDAGSKSDNPATTGIGNTTGVTEEHTDTESITWGVSVSGTYQDTHEEGYEARVIKEQWNAGTLRFRINVLYNFGTTINETDVISMKLATDAYSDDPINIHVYDFTSSSWDDTGSNVQSSETTVNITICSSQATCADYISDQGEVWIRSRRRYTHNRLSSNPH